MHGRVTQGIQAGREHPAAGCPAANSSTWEVDLFPLKSSRARQGVDGAGSVPMPTSSRVSLPHSPPWPVAGGQRTIIVITFSADLTPGRATQSPLSSNRKEAVVVGRARAPAPEMRPCPGTSGESGQVISPLPPAETVPLEIACPSMWRWWGLHELGKMLWCMGRNRLSPVRPKYWPPKQTGQWGPHTSVHTCGHKWDKWAGSDRAERMARRGRECLCEAAWRDGERHTETGSVCTRQMLWPPFTDELAETPRD